MMPYDAISANDCNWGNLCDILNKEVIDFILIEENNYVKKIHSGDCFYVIWELFFNG